MWTLAIETASQHPSLALLEEEDCRALTPLDARACAATLVPAIGHWLASRTLTLADVGLLAAADGPGSFTGIRIGLATVKALAEATSLPAVSVGTLTALLASAASSSPAWAALDAGKGEIYYAHDAIEGLLPQAAFLDLLERVPQDHGLAVTPDASLAALSPRLQLVDPLLAAAVGRLGRARWLQQQGRGDDLLAMDARYLGGRWGA
ncbi:MAG: tRNA (adenosine(37)-N6)-threonylcarbamoyltransferase complex dimerization subunit type 1 TsaB [Terriglobales bacterium]